MLYCLTHANVLSQSGVPDRLRKRIGHYSTLKKALAARERAAAPAGLFRFSGRLCRGTDLLRRRGGGRAAAPEALEACEVLVGVDGWTEGFDTYVYP